MRIISQHFYEWGNKPSRLLARSLKQKKAASYISKIKTPADVLLHKTCEIAKEFCSFYQQLYNVGKGVTEGASRDTLIKNYLTQAKLPKLPAQVFEALEGGFSSAELEKAFKSMANGKAPGPDSFTVAYYRAFSGTLLPHLTSYANSISAGGGLPSGDSPRPYHSSPQTREGSEPLR